MAEIIEYETNCTSITLDEWEALMNGAKIANKRHINQLVKTQLPGLYERLGLEFPNPYRYYKTKTHYILCHSAIEYFLKRK